MFFRNIDEVIKERLQLAKESIKIAVAWFTDENLAGQLILLLSKEIKVEVIIIDDEINKRSNWVNALTSFPNCKFYKIDPKFHEKMHHKFCIIDDEIVITGSYNWTNKAKTNLENIVILEEESVVNKYVLEFKKIIDKYCRSNIELKIEAAIEILETLAKVHENTSDRQLLYSNKIDKEKVERHKCIVNREFGNKEETEVVFSKIAKSFSEDRNYWNELLKFLGEVYNKKIGLISEGAEVVPIEYSLNDLIKLALNINIIKPDEIYPLYHLASALTESHLELSNNTASKEEFEIKYEEAIKLSTKFLNQFFEKRGFNDFESDCGLDAALLLIHNYIELNDKDNAIQIINLLKEQGLAQNRDLLELEEEIENSL